MIELDRRQLIRRLLVAPAIVAASSLMPVRSVARFLGDDLDTIRLSDFVYDGFNYLNSWGEKFCGNPVGRLHIIVRNGEIVKQDWKSGTDFYKLGEWPSKRIGALSDADHATYIDNLHASIAASTHR